MQGRQEKRLWMDQLHEVVEDAGRARRPEREFEWLTYSLTFSEAVPRLHEGEYDEIVEEVLLAISDDPPSPGQSVRWVINWSGFGQLVAEGDREPDSDRVRVHVRMFSMLDAEDSFWDVEEFIFPSKDVMIGYMKLWRDGSIHMK